MFAMVFERQFLLYYGHNLKFYLRLD